MCLPPDLQNEDDGNLLKSFKRGSDAAFRAIYDRYHLDVWRFIRSREKDKEDAQDVFAEVWSEAFSKLPEFEWRGIPIKSWLLTTANNKLREHFRRKKKRIALNEEIRTQAVCYIDARLRLDGASPPKEHPTEVHYKADQFLEKALSSLNPRWNEIIRLTYYKGKNSTEIGQILGMKPGTVRVYRTRALKKLRTWFEKQEAK